MNSNLISHKSGWKHKIFRGVAKGMARVAHVLDKVVAEKEPEDKQILDTSVWRPINDELRQFGDRTPLERPAPKMERPVLMVPGYHTHGDAYDRFANTLTQDGANGERWYFMEDGAVFDSENPNQAVFTVPKDTKVFVARFENNHETPEVAAERLAEYSERIAKFTDHQKSDHLSFSMGGLISRTYLESEAPRLGKLMQVGTPNQGVAKAELAATFLEVRPQEYGPAGRVTRLIAKAEAGPALQALRPVDNNPSLQRLNEAWPSQREKLEDFQVVGSDGKWTLAPGFGLQRGDGQVHVDSLELPGEEPILVNRSDNVVHRDLLHNDEVFDEAASFFGWAFAAETSEQNKI